jgi:hypothetical protein
MAFLNATAMFIPRTPSRARCAFFSVPDATVGAVAMQGVGKVAEKLAPVQRTAEGVDKTVYGLCLDFLYASLWTFTTSKNDRVLRLIDMQTMQLSAWIRAERGQRSR